MKKLLLLMLPLFMIQCSTKDKTDYKGVSKQSQKVKELKRINDSLDNELSKY